MKSIILYSRELKAQNLYPKRIISPPAPNKCCPSKMEVLGRPRVDEQGRRFCYKRCRVCGFALRHFLEPVGTILTPAPVEAKPPRKPLPAKERPVQPVAYLPARVPVRLTGRKPVASHHTPARVSRRPHPVEATRKSAVRRRR